jgi:hypothetical protein
MKAPKVERPIIHDASDVALRGEALSPIIWQGRQWAVTTHGVEARDGSYSFTADRLHEGLRREHPYSWVAHMAGKRWIDLEDFTTAFFVACAVFSQPLRREDVELVLKHFADRRRELADQS